MEEQQWRSESVGLDAPPTVQTTTVPSPKLPAGKQIPWKWLFGAGVLIVILVVGLMFLRGYLAKNQKPTNNGQVKTQDVDLGKLTKNTTPLTLDKTDRVVINGQLQTNQGLVINPTVQPTTSVLGQVYLDSTTGALRYYNGTTYLTIANSDAVGLTQAEVLAMLTAFGTKLPQDLATTASPLFGGLKLNGTNGNSVLLQAAAGTANVTLTLPVGSGTVSQCLTTDGAGTLSFSACASGSGNAFLQGGNAFATTGVLGTTDSNDLNFITNNTTRLTVTAGGNVGIGNTTPGNKLSINIPTSLDGLAQTLIATGAVANKGLVVQGVIFQTGSLLELQEHTGSSVFSVGATGTTTIRTATNTTAGFQVQNSAGSGVLNVDTTNSRIGIGNTNPAYKLDVNGDINIVGTSALRIGGTVICIATGCDATSSSGFYIQNGNGIQSNANFAIQSANANYVGSVVRGRSGQVASLMELQVSNATAVFSVGATGNVLARASANSATAFSIQNAAGNSNLFLADTTQNYVGIGIAPAYKLDVNGDINIETSSALRFGGLQVCTSTGCTTNPGSGSYIQNGNGIQSNANFAIQSADANYIGSRVRGAVGQTADLFRLETSTGASLLNVSASGSVTMQNTTDSVNALTVRDSTGLSRVLVVDTLNKRVGINSYPSGYSLEVNGDANLSNNGSLRINGNIVCDLNGCAAASGSGDYIQNGNGLQTNGNFAIQSANIGYVGGLIKGAGGQTADLLQIQNSGSANLFKVDAAGNATFQNSADNGAAFNIKQSAGTTIFWADTLQGTVNATNAAGNAFVGTTNNNLSYGVLGTQSFGVGGGVKGVGGGGYGIYGQSTANASGFFQTSVTDGLNAVATLVARANTSQTANVFEVQNTAGTPVLGVSVTGALTTGLVNGQLISSAASFSGTLAVATLGSATNAIYLCRNGTNQMASCNTTGNGAAFIQGGNSFGAQAVLGTADANSLAFNTGNQTRAILDTSGNLAFQQTSILSTAAGNLTLQSTAGSSTIALQAGSGGFVNIGSNAVTGTIQIGNTAGAVAQTVNIGNNTTVSSTTATTIGSKIGTSPTKLHAGSSGVVVQAADSANAFSVQNAATATLFNVDTTNNVIKIGGNNSAILQGWANTIALGSTLNQHATVTNGSYLYTVAGYGTSLTAIVKYAPINPNGTVGAWTDTTALGGTEAQRQYPGAVIANGYMYAIGGADSTTATTTTIYYGAINSNGTISSWKLADNKMATAVAGAGVVAYNGYLYILGGATAAPFGSPGTPTASVQYAKLNADGSVGSFCVSGSTCSSPFTAPAALPAARMVGQAIVSNGYLYYVGGQDSASAGQKDIYRTKINSDGSLGSWTTFTGVNGLNTARGYLSVGVLNGYLYAVGGGPALNSQVNSYEYAQIGASGSLGTFTQISGTLTTAPQSLGMATANGYFYIVSGSSLGEVQYASGPRIFVGGSLDLVGLGGNGLQGSSGGGTLTAGNTLIAGRLRVTDAANFMQGVNIYGDIFGSGQAVFRSTTDSSTAFAVQNASGSSVIAVDTANALINPGFNSASISTARLISQLTTQSVDDYTNSGTFMAMGGDGRPIIGTNNSTIPSKFIVQKCLNSTCSNGVTQTSFSSPYSASNTISSSTIIMQKNGLPIIGLRDGSAGKFFAIVCTQDDCASGSKYLTTTTTLTGLNVSGALSADGIPFFFYKSSTSLDIAMMGCTTDSCVALGPEQKILDANSVGGSASASIGMDKKPIVAYQDVTGTDTIKVTTCNDTLCSSFVSGSTTNVISYPGNDIGTNTIMAIPSDGRPVIVTQNVTAANQDVLVYKCLNSTCSSYSGPFIVDNSTAINTGGFGMTIGVDDLPIITYRRGAVTSVVVVHCGNSTCSSGNITTSIAGDSNSFNPFGRFTTPLIGNDGFPLIVTNGGPTGFTGSSVKNNSVIHCVDITCAAATAVIPGGGVSLGSKALVYSGLYVNTINEGRAPVDAPLRVTSDKKIWANSLSSDVNGVVKVLSTSATALIVQNTDSSATVLSVDSTTNSVNIGTSTSVAGYGFNSASAALFRNGTNSTSQFAIQNSSSSSLFNVDSTNNRINLFSALSAIAAPASPAAAVPAQNGTPTVTVTGATGTTGYNYIIEAVTTIGNSAPSAASITTTTGNATLSSTNYNALSWAAFVPASGSTTYYRIYRTVGGSTTGLIGTTTGTIFSDTGFVANGTSVTAGGNLAASTQYFYKVTAIDSAGGESPASTEVNATTGGSTKTIALTWTAVTGATGYKIYRSTTTNTQVYLTATGASPFTDNGSVTIGTGSAPSSGTAYKSTNNSNSALQLVVGGNGTPTGQLYVSGTVPTSAVGSLAVGATPNAVVTQGRYVYTVSSGTNTLQVIDASIPSSPVIVSTIATGTFPSSVVVQGAYVYVTNQTSNTMQIYNVSNPAGPILVSTTSTGTTPREIKVVGRYAYVVNNASSTLQIFDVANPATPVAVSSITTVGANPIGLVVRGNYAYVAYSGSNAIRVFDISSPTTPVLTGTVDVGQTTYRMSIQGKYLYVVSFFSNTFIIVDISNAYNPVLVSTTSIGTGPRGAVVNGRYVYVTNATSNTLQIFDVANPATPASLGTVATGTTPYAPVVNGRYVYVVNATSSNLQIFDVGGAYIQQLETGGAEIGSLMVNNAAVFAAEASFQGGINTNGSLQTTADLGVAGNALFKTSTNSNTAFQIQNATSVSLLSVDTTGNGTININAAADTGIINIGTAYSAVITIGKSAGTGTLIVYGNTTVNGHIISGNNSGSTSFAVGAAACTSGVATSSAGNDTAGKIIVTTGASGCAAGTIVTVTFGTTYTTAPMVVVTPGDSVTAGEIPNYYATPTGSTFVLGTQTTTTINKTLIFYYHVIR